MPQIKKAIEDVIGEYYGASFNVENILIHDPSKAIAKGAALYHSFTDRSVTPGPPPIDQIAESSYGWRSLNSDKTPPETMLYFNLFKETSFGCNDTIRVDVEVPFHAVLDTQTEVSFVAYESNVRPEDCEDGHWVPIEDNINHKECGLEVTVTIPAEYQGKARSYNLYPQLILNRNGELDLVVYDTPAGKNGRSEYDRPLKSSNTYIH